LKPLSQDCAVVETVKIPVGAGLLAKRPGLLANLHLPFTVAAATVFAGKPAPTQIGGGHTSRVGHRTL
ncbi:hypothetical protein, partial [Pseudomonas alloputida]|uniref:hypothetical protein n=1 Tax=Pseudomonas alloputida TaxID=1940621 RepID=UPI00320AF15F